MLYKNANNKAITKLDICRCQDNKRVEHKIFYVTFYAVENGDR